MERSAPLAPLLLYGDSMASRERKPRAQRAERAALATARDQMLTDILDCTDESGKTLWEKLQSDGLTKAESLVAMQNVLFANMFDVRGSSSNQAVAGYLTLMDKKPEDLDSDDLSSAKGKMLRLLETHGDQSQTG